MKTGSETYEAPARSSGSLRFLKRTGRIVGLTVIWFALLLLSLWAVAALYVDCRIAALRVPLVVIYVAAVLLVLVFVKRWKALACLACFCAVLGWWLSLQP